MTDEKVTGRIRMNRKSYDRGRFYLEVIEGPAVLNGTPLGRTLEDARAAFRTLNVKLRTDGFPVIELIRGLRVGDE